MRLLFKGRFRIYFNRKEDAPEIWSVDKGSQKTEVLCTGYETATKICNGENLQAEWPEPRAWIQGFGAVYMNDNGRIAIYDREREAVPNRRNV